ncbi:Retrovirus-related Pol polyprotein, partial [Mucuna pruriens]
MEEAAKPIRQHQRRMNLTILDVVKKEVTKLLAAGIIYPILESQWMSPVQVVPKKSGMIVMKNLHDDLVHMRIQNNWRVYIDYRRLNQATHKDHFPLPFIDQVLEKLSGKSHYYFLDGFSEGIVLGHLVSNRGTDVDKSKIDIITSLLNPAFVREVRSFLGHAGFYRSPALKPFRS